MNVVIAIDSFKGSLSSIDAGNAACRGVLLADPDASVTVRPLADGGEGTAVALTDGMNGIRREINVTGPLDGRVDASYGISQDGTTAVIDISAAAGITLVPDGKLDPMHATTYGVGEMIRDAIENGCRRFIIGLGGSATNDGGIGMLQALGFGMLDKDGAQVPYGAAGLRTLRRITADDVMPELAHCEFKAACDVDNPLCGEDGASAVFGPQKGADPAMIMNMDRWLAKYAGLAAPTGYDSEILMNRTGAGAAGGLGFAFMTFLGAELEPGVNIILEETQLEDYIRFADIVITGEGRIDGQTARGKAPAGVAAIAHKYGKPVIAFAGSTGADARKCNDCGIDAYFPILQGPVTLQEAMTPETARHNMTAAAEQAVRLFEAARH